MSGGSPSDTSLGETVIIVGLVIQLIFFSFYMITTALFHRKMCAYPTGASFSTQISWRKHLFTLYAVSVLVMLRSIFRVAEYVQGSEGVLLRYEAYLFVFDATLMWVLMVVLNVVHPGEISEALMVSDVKSRTGGGSRLEMNPCEGRLTRSDDESSQEDVRVAREGSARRTIYARHGLV